MWWGSGTVLKRYLREMQHLGFMVYNDIESCIPWCRNAKECGGEQMYNKIMAQKNVPAQKKIRLYGSASIRSIAPRARSAIFSGTVIRGCSDTSASRTLTKSVFFMFLQIAACDNG